MDGILSSALGPCAAASPPEDVVRAMNVWLPKFQAELDKRVTLQGRKLWLGLLEADEDLKSAFDDFQSKIESPDVVPETLANLKAFVSEKSERAFNEITRNFVKDASDELLILEKELKILRDKINPDYYENRKNPSTSPLDLYLAEHKLSLTADLAPLFSEEKFINELREIDQTFRPIVTHPPENPLDLIEAVFPLLRSSQRAAIVAVTEKWLFDRSASSTELKRLLETQTRALRRKNAVKIAIQK